MAKNITKTSRWVDRRYGLEEVAGGATGGSASSGDLTNYYTKLQTDSSFVNIGGDTMTGDLNIGADLYLGTGGVGKIIGNADTGNDYIEIDSNDTDDIKLVVNGAHIFVVDSATAHVNGHLDVDDNVDIGGILSVTTASGEAGDFDANSIVKIENDASAFIEFKTPQAGYAGMYFTDNTDQAGGVVYGHNNSPNINTLGLGAWVGISLRVGSKSGVFAKTEVVGISATGVDVTGTLSTTSKLDVTGDIEATGDIYANDDFWCGDDLIMLSNAGAIRADTADGTDNQYVAISGGGGVSTTRGGYILLGGNESSTYPGNIVMRPGSGTGSGVHIDDTIFVANGDVSIHGLLNIQDTAPYIYMTDTNASGAPKSYISASSGVGGMLFAADYQALGTGPYMAFRVGDSGENAMMINSGENVVIKNDLTVQGSDVQVDGTLSVDTESWFIGKMDIDGSVMHDSAGGNQPFHISRYGDELQCLKIHVTDTDAVFESVQDENITSYGGFDFILDAGGVTNSFLIKKDSTTLFDVNDTTTTLATDNLTGNITFSSGFNGDGWKLEKTNINEYDLELDNMIIRGALRAYEFIIQKIRASNGAIWVSDAAKCVEGITYDDASILFRITFDEDYNVFREGDIIKTQAWNGTEIYSEEYVVETIDGSSAGLSPRSTVGINKNDGLALGYNDSSIAQMVDVDASAFSIGSLPLYGYDVTWSSVGTYIKSNSFNIRGVGPIDISLGWFPDTGGDNDLEFEVYSDGGTLLSETTSILVNDITNLEGYASTINVDVSAATDVSCHIRVKADSVNTGVSNFQIQGINEYTTSVQDTVVDSKNRDFVRIGNISDTGRQGSLYMTANDTDAPYLDVIDGVNIANIQNENIKTRLGKLDGLSFLDASISGYGLYAQNAYLTGFIDSDSGRIGGWQIDNGRLIAEGTNGKIDINSENQNIQIYDDEGSPKAKLGGTELSTLASLVGGTTYTYDTGECAGATLTYTNTTGQTSGTTKFILVNSGNVYDATSDNDSYHFNVGDDKSYSLSYSINMTEDPSLITPQAGAVSATIEGGYEITFTLKAYDHTDNLLATVVKKGGPNQSYYPDTIITTELGIIPDQCYFTLAYSIENDVKQADFNGIEFIGYQNIETEFTITTTELKIIGSVGTSEIASNGMQSVWDSDKYFRVDSVDATNFIQTAGEWDHQGGMRVNVTSSSAANYNMLVSDYMLSYSYGSPGGTVTLPASPETGQVYVISASASNGLVIVGNSKNIQYDGNSGAATMTLGAYETIMLIYQGSEWKALTKYA